MPYGKKKGKSTGKPRTRRNRRTYRRYRKTNSALARPYNGAINLYKSPLPETFKTTLRYTEYDKLSILLSNQVSTHIYCLNGLYDPDISLTGHQPRGFDQLMALYGKYMVIGCKVTFELINTLALPVQAGYSIMTTSVAGGYMSDYMEGATDCQYITLGASGSTTDRYKGVVKFSPKKYFKKSNLSDDAQMVGTASANPSLPAYLHIFAAQQGAASNQTNAIWGTYTLEYIVVLKEPKIVVSS